MSDPIELPDGTLVPIQDTICECNHWYEEHDVGTECGAPLCQCLGFVADPALSTAEAIADRGGDPDQWPDHVKVATGIVEADE